MKKVVLATNNQGKLNELQSILSDKNWELLPQSLLDVPEAEETGLTFIENAIIKARNASAHSNMPAIADDSGLVVPTLNGEPGIYSARYAGESATASSNIDKLLNEMISIPDDQRQAYFYCVIAYMEHPDDPTPLIAHGRLDGRIVRQATGTEGFGYDPIFTIPGLNLTAAQLPANVKNKISHRAKALNQLFHLLNSNHA